MDSEYCTTIEYKSFDTTVKVVFINTPKPNFCQQKNLDDFRIKQNDLQNDLLANIFKYYKKSYDAYREGWVYGSELSGRQMSETELEKYLPIPTTPEKLKEHITPSTIYIPGIDKCEDGLFGITFDCTWDMQSSLGVLIKKWKVAEVSTADISFIYF